MDQEKISKFISNLRKKHQLTQAEMASRLNVTSQAVSKWENGRGIPDIELIKKISDEFNVDINDLLNGEESKKKNKILIYFALIFCLILILIFIWIKHNPKEEFHFISLSSNNTSFSLKGIAAYSDDKKSIYINNIRYTEEATDEVYFLVECSLYESINDVDKKITDCIIQNNSHEDEYKTLDELVASIELQVASFETVCKEVCTDDLYLFIKVLNINNKVITHKIPIKIEENFNK